MIIAFIILVMLIWGMGMGCTSEKKGNGVRMTGGKNVPNPTNGMGTFRALRYIAREHSKMAYENKGWFVANCMCTTCVDNQKLYFKNLKRAEKGKSLLTPTPQPRAALNAWFDRKKQR